MKSIGIIYFEGVGRTLYEKENEIRFNDEVGGLTYSFKLYPLGKYLFVDSDALFEKVDIGAYGEDAVGVIATTRGIVTIYTKDDIHYMFTQMDNCSKESMVLDTIVAETLELELDDDSTDTMDISDEG